MSWCEERWPDELYDRLESFGQEMLALRGFSALATDWNFIPMPDSAPVALEDLIAL